MMQQISSMERSGWSGRSESGDIPVRGLMNYILLNPSAKNRVQKASVRAVCSPQWVLTLTALTGAVVGQPGRRIPKRNAVVIAANAQRAREPEVNVQPFAHDGSSRFHSRQSLRSFKPRPCERAPATPFAGPGRLAGFGYWDEEMQRNSTLNTKYRGKYARWT